MGVEVTQPERDGRVAVPAVDDGTAVDRDHVALDQPSRPRDPVHDLVVDRHAQAGREPVVALERRHRAAVADVLLGDGVELAGRDARAAPRSASARACAPTTSPARRMLAICSGVLISTPRPWNMPPPQSSADSSAAMARSVTVVHRAGGVDAAQQPGLGVVVDQRRRLLAVDLEPVPDRAGRVVVAPEQLTSAGVAHPLVGGLVELHVPVAAAPVAGTPARQPPHDLVLVDRQLQHGVQRDAQQRPGSRPGPRPAGTVRGNPSSRKPGWASSSASRSRTMAIVTSSGTRSPASMYFFASTPSSVCWATLARKMSPVEICGIPKCLAMWAACVPFPAPGGPTRTVRISAGTLRSCAAAAGSRSVSRCPARRRR